MSIVLGVIGIGGVIGTVIIGRKAWHGFHRAVGIQPKKMTYIPPEIAYEQENQAFTPKLIQVNLIEKNMAYLPLSVKQQIQRIDDKAHTFQNWLADLNNQNTSQTLGKMDTIQLDENQFVLSKLMSQHLPDIVTTYHNICHRKNSLNQAQSQTSSHFIDNHHNNSPHQNQIETALSILLELLDDIEQRLDSLLHQCEQRQLQDLEVMRRYLKARD